MPWPRSGSYMRLGRSTQTERCCCRKSSGICGQGIRWNQVNFICPLLSSLELRLTLLEEGPDAFLHVFRLHQRQELQEDVMDMLVERLVPRHAHHALGGLHGERRVGRDL